MKKADLLLGTGKTRSIQMAWARRWTWPLFVLGLFSTSQLATSQHNNQHAAVPISSASSIRLKALGLTDSQIDEVRVTLNHESHNSNRSGHRSRDGLSL
jgi:hypothetical protein